MANSGFRCGYVAALLLAANAFSLPAGQGAVVDQTVPEDYRIGVGDVLHIVVWKEPDASVPEAMVRVDGKITVPLIGELAAAGFTPRELKDLLVKRLSDYINNPVVTIQAKEINSRRVYVVGNVKKEGPISLIRPLTVLQAINEAGGLGEWANRKKIYILRKAEGKEVRLRFDYAAVIKGQRLEQNIPLLPDDTIVVP